ncbi:hypothetical protein JCM11641_000247 [Rhodosporidiobolus odoratus]
MLHVQRHSDQDPLLSPTAFSPPAPPTSRGPLHPGATWAGVQRSGRNSYEVVVKVNTVDLNCGTMCGTLEIKGLTPELASLVTFFEGEIIGAEGLPGFRTGKYGANPLDDFKHWRRFPAFTRNRLDTQLVGSEANLQDSRNQPQLFMRWKEKFVVGVEGQHRLSESIHGASFAGFYYCCLDMEPASSPSNSSGSPHRGISPAPRPCFRARRSSSTLLANSSSSLSTQSRFTSSVSLSFDASPLRVDLAQPTSPPSFIDLSSFATSPIASSLSSALPASTSSASASLSTPPLDAATTPPPTEVATPKLETVELDMTFAIELPAESPHPDPSPATAPQLPPLVTLSPLSATTTAATWPASSVPPLVPNLRRMNSDAAGVVAQTRGRTALTYGNEYSISEDQREEDAGTDDRGLTSWTDATISGFYFHASASPYQELSLRYVATTQGGSAQFSFR